MSTRNDPFQLEQRLAHKLRDAEYLLLLVLGLMLWTAGFVDLLTSTTEGAPVLGMYSVGGFVALAVFTVGFAGWAALIFPRHSIPALRSWLAIAQQVPWVGITCTGAAAMLFGTLLVWEPWLFYPLLSASVVLLLALFLGLVLLAPVARAVPMQRWRKVVLAGLAALVLLEAALQAAASAGLLPTNLVNLSGLAVPYGHVYQRREGAINATMNRYGWPYPAFKLAPGSTRIILTGGTYVQALQVDPRHHMGAVLESRLRERADHVSTEVLALGTPAYGPGVYADPILFPYTMKAFVPSEVVVVFHLADDLQTVDGPGHEIPFFVRDAQGRIDAHADDVERRHTLWHALIRGYEPIHPVTVLKSHSFLLTGIDEAWRGFRGQPALLPAVMSNLDAMTDVLPFGTATFAFRREPSADVANTFDIATGLLSQYVAALDAQGVRVRLVTIPHFPPQFYAAGPDAGWDAHVSEFDLLRPDRVLAAFAAERRIPFLSWGSYLAASGVTRSQVRQLFHRDGSGHLTSAGHSQVADAIDTCFYGPGAPACAAPAALVAP